MPKFIFVLAVIITFFSATADAQLKKQVAAAKPGLDIAAVPVSKADPG